MSDGDIESFFGPVEENENTNYIPPDYSDENVEDDSDFDEDTTDEDEGILETIEDEKHKTEERKEMISTPFSSDSGSGSSQWGNSGNSSNPGSPWSQQNSSSSIWQQSTRPSWGSSNSPSWGSSFGSIQNNQKQEIPRKKKVVFCDFLDCMVETYQSNGLPGLKPRDIYDLKPRFNVWEKLAAFNPEKIFAMIPPNTLSTTNGSDGWQVTLAYWCSCLSAFLNIPYTNCQVLSQTIIGQPKEYAIIQTLQTHRIARPDAVYVGIYSGVCGQSDRDINAARISEIDYIDLNTLLNSMI